MTVSIIIAVKTWQKNLEECVSKCLQLDYPDFEIIILPDEPFKVNLLPSGNIHTLVIATGPITPGEKRDIGLSRAKGEIVAFLDDDAWPVKGWLKNAVANFNDPEVAAVGGPAVTPDNDGLRQKASGLVYSSFLMSGPYFYRYIPGRRQEADDLPSCNLLVNREIMVKLGGFDTNYWPGEDTKLCQDITRKLNKKIIYDPAALVYHHRRKLFGPHLKQIINYALHRGYFARKKEPTSLKVAYFVPSAFFIFILLGGMISLFSNGSRQVYLSLTAVYFFIVAIFSLNKNVFTIPLVFLGIFLSHLAYGFYFLKGLFSEKLREDL